MTAIPKIIIMLALWLLYTFLVWEGCSEELCCAPGATTEVSPPDTGAVTVKRYPLDFKWKDPTAYTNAGFDSFRQSILAKGGETGILEITGLYFESEPKPAGYENMGFARADKVKALFANRIPADRIQTRARVIDEPAAARTGYFEGVLFEWRTPDKNPAKTVEELADRIIIRFPFGSLEKTYDPAVDDYLNKLATRMKETGETVVLTGHTDNVGADESNLSFGKRRAEAIKAILVGKGVKATQITTDSKGEAQPVATNDTNEGRYENRRVEVRLNKKQ